MNLKSRLARVEQTHRKQVAALEAQITRNMRQVVEIWERKHGPVTPKDAGGWAAEDLERLTDTEFVGHVKHWLIQEQD